MACLLYRTDGTKERITPPSGEFSLEEMQTLVGGYIEIVRTIDDRFMVIDEEGKLKGKPLNIDATRLYLYGRQDPIVGEAIVADTWAEVGGNEP